MAFKSEKDREAYVGKLRAAGFSSEEIDADVAEIEAVQPAPTPVAPPPVAAQPNLQPAAPAEAVRALAEVAQARDQQNQDLTGQVLGSELSQAVKDLSGSTLGKIGLAAVGGYGLYKAGRLAERKFGPSGETVNRIEPTMEPVRESARLPAAAQQSGLSEADQALLAKSEANRIAKEQEALKRAAAAPPAPPSEPPAFIRNQPPVAQTPVTNPKIPALLQAPAGAVAPPVATAPVAAPVAPVAPAPTVAPPVAEVPVVTAPVAPAPVAETPVTKAPVAETPKAAPPPAAEPEKLNKQQKGMKNHLVGMYGGGAEGEAAYNKVKQILGYTPEYPVGQGGSLTPEQHQVIKDWRKANIEGPKVNLSHDMKKALKSGTAISVLMAIPGFAAAAQEKDFGKMTDIATDLLVLPFAQSREVGEGEQYELAKRRYEGMVGGGRGVAPPSAYLR